MKKPSPRQARGRAGAKKKPIRPPLQLDLDLDMALELDFDTDDFDIVDGETKPRPEKQRDVRILRPRIDVKELSQHVCFDNAKAFAKQIDLTPGARTFAWVSGNFIFGDIVEALIVTRGVSVKRLYVSSLSISQENVDGLKNIMLIMGDALEQLTLILSGWTYSKHKFDLVPYMYQELDDPMNRVQIVFGRWHAKLITLETLHGHTITIHGSANLPSNNSIEQIMVEIDDKELHDFNARLMDAIADKYGTINQSAEYAHFRPIPRKEAWEAVTGELEQEG